MLLSVTSSRAQHKNNSEGGEKVAVSFGLKISERLERARYTVNLPCFTDIIREEIMVITVQALLLTPCCAFLLSAVCAIVASAHPWASGGLISVCRVLWVNALVRREGIIYYCRDWKLPDVIIMCSDGGYFYCML